MFKKFTSALSTGLDKVVDYSQAQILVALTKRYPDIGEVQELLAHISNESNEAIEGKKYLWIVDKTALYLVVIIYSLLELFW